MNYTLEFNVRVRVRVEREGSWHVLTALGLDISSQGKSLKQARANLADAVRLFLLSCFERGVLESTLKECGFYPDATSLQQDDREADMLDVPLPLLVAKHVEQAHPC